ncbi:carbamoyl-phosphate synthase [Synechococcus sp. UW179A]|uniref:carbamoyl-phosphate synthase n=1 Tax=Synechococcus sp. UW179A TaxID=2575510 RepID=UPI0010BE2EF2|nr:carbamoyl-phosphate synthase [Synechococcus sp. UW179A]
MVAGNFRQQLFQQDDLLKHPPPHLDTFSAEPARMVSEPGVRHHARTHPSPMLRRLTIGLLISATAIAPFPLKAQDGMPEDLGDAISINLKDVVKFNWGFQGALQDAGVTNRIGAGFFYPFSIKPNKMWFLDSRFDLNLGDYNINPEYLSSSINDVQVQGVSISTSTRIGYRWIDRHLNRGFGVSAGYDSRPLIAGFPMDEFIKEATAFRGGPQTQFFQQLALSAVTAGEKSKVSAYGLFPIGDYGIGSNKVAAIYGFYGASPLMTTGIDLEYEVFPSIKVLTGFYYQSNESEPPLYVDPVSGFGFKAQLTGDINDYSSIYARMTRDLNFKTRYSAGFIVRFAKETDQNIKSGLADFANSSPDYRYVRVNCSEANPSRAEDEQCGD